MKRAILISISILVQGFFTWALSQNTRVITYNIKFDNPRDSLNNWDHRKDDMSAFFRYYAPDIFGIQEGLIHQLEYLDSQLTDYARIGVGRDDGKEKGEFSAIFFKKAKYDVSGASTFWLSPTPEKISVGWDAAMERISTYGILEKKEDGTKLLVFNTHFDHIGAEARLQSVKLILSKMEELNTQDLPILVMGDFNLEPSSEPIQEMKISLKDAGEIAKNGIYGPKGTFTGFDEKSRVDRRIDYLFISSGSVLNYRHMDDRRKDGGFISDHLPVMAEIKF